MVVERNMFLAMEMKSLYTSVEERAKVLDRVEHQAKRDLMEDIEKYRVKTGCIIISEIACIAIKQKHFNTKNSKEVKKQ